MSEEANWQQQTVEPTAGVVTKAATVVLFHTEQVKDNFQTKLQNRPVFREKVFIKILTGGDNLTVIDRPLRELDKEQYAQQWEQWERTRQNRIPGIPIELWHSISDTQKAEFKALNIFTIEQFAQLPDSIASKIMGFHDLRAKAKVFIEAGKDAELMGNIRKEMDQKLAAKDAELDEMKRLMAQKLEALEKRMEERAKPKKSNWKKKPQKPVDVEAPAQS